MNALVTADIVDEAAIRARSGELGAVEADAAVMRARVHQEVFSVLTAEQQAKAKELRAQMQERSKQRMENRKERRPGRENRFSDASRAEPAGAAHLMVPQCIAPRPPPWAGVGDDDREPSTTCADSFSSSRSS